MYTNVYNYKIFCRELARVCYIKPDSVKKKKMKTKSKS